MSDQDVVTHHHGTVPCISCHEPIQRGAEVCIHCDSRQSWTRRVVGASGIITAILAFVPLWTGAAALYHIAFATHAADVRVRALSCDLKSVSLAVTNLGDRAAIVGGYSLVVSDSGQVTPPYSLLAKKPMTVVRPEKTIVLSLEPRMTGTSTGISVPPVATDCKFEISVEVNAFEGGASQQKVTCDCPPAA